MSDDAYADAILPLLERVRTTARGVKEKGGKPYKQDRTLDREALLHHVNGGPAYGAYPIRPGESVCRMAVLDLDSHKGETSWSIMQDVAASVCAELQGDGMAPHPWRSSGGAGIHIVLVWADWQDARSVRIYLRGVLDRLGYADGARGVANKEIEVFPKQDRVPDGGYGNYFFLPGAFQSVPLDEFSLAPLPKSAVAGYVWIDSPPVAVAPPDERANRATRNEDADLDEVAAAVACIQNDEAAGRDYEFWLRIVAGIHSADSGPDGKEIAEAWSEQSPRHTRKWFEHTWAHLRADRDEGAGVGTIFHHARACGWQPSNAPIIEALAAAAVGVETDDPTNPPAPSAGPNSHGIDPPGYLRHPKTNAALVCVLNARLGLEYRQACGEFRLGFDSFRDEIMFSPTPGFWRPLNDVDVTRLRIGFEAAAGHYQIVGLGREIMRDAVAAVADENRFDSGQIWLDSLAWDGVPRIAGFLARYYGAEDTDYTRAASRYFWTALAGRIIEPGAQADMTLIMVGAQGVGKSTGLQSIVPSPEFHVEISLADKDENLARMLRGRLLVELGELKGMRAREIEHTKAFLTRRREAWVPKFREFATEYPRRNVFVGTTNEDEFLEDSTGNRRFLPVRVGAVDRVAITRDRLQLWAEAREAFNGDRAFGGPGIAWQDAERLAREVHDEFVVEDGWEADVVRWLGERENPEAPFSTIDVAKGALLMNASSIVQSTKKRIAGVLRRLGYHDGRIYSDGRRVRVWARRPTQLTIGGTVPSVGTGEGQ